MAVDDWKVREHGPIEKLAENLWRVQGTLPGMSLRRVMTVARMQDGRLVFHSAIALAESAIAELEAWGSPTFMLVPSGYHRLDAPAYKKRYPSLSVLTPSGSRARVEQVLPVQGTYADFPSVPSVRLEPLPGVGDREGAMFVHSADGTTLVLNDVIFNMDRKRDPLGWFFTTLLGSAPGPRVSRLAKLTLVQDPPVLRRHLERLAETPDLVRLIVSHEKVALGSDAAAALRRAATFLRSV
jgi:hypothetical protein